VHLSLGFCSSAIIAILLYCDAAAILHLFGDPLYVIAIFIDIFCAGMAASLRVTPISLNHDRRSMIVMPFCAISFAVFSSTELACKALSLVSGDQN
jgi:hypothetical protein